MKTLQNFADLLKPGGVLLLDFRNFQSMLERGTIVKNGANPGALHVSVAISVTRSTEQCVNKSLPTIVELYVYV